MNKKLFVRLFEEEVGILEQDKNGELRFAYLILPTSLSPIVCL
jgi:hypothetical protein